MKRMNFEQGQIVYNQGDRSHFCYQVTNGSVEIRRATRDSSGAKEIKTLEKLQPGAVFGVMALIPNAPHAASAVAAEPTGCIAYTPEEVLDVLESDPKEAHAFAMTLIKRLRHANVTVVEPEQGE